MCRAGSETDTGLQATLPCPPAPTAGRPGTRAGRQPCSGCRLSVPSAWPRLSPPSQPSTSLLHPSCRPEATMPGRVLQREEVVPGGLWMLRLAAVPAVIGSWMGHLTGAC